MSEQQSVAQDTGVKKTPYLSKPADRKTLLWVSIVVGVVAIAIAFLILWLVLLNRTFAPPTLPPQTCVPVKVPNVSDTFGALPNGSMAVQLVANPLDGAAPAIYMLEDDNVYMKLSISTAATVLNVVPSIDISMVGYGNYNLGVSGDGTRLVTGSVTTYEYYALVQSSDDPLDRTAELLAIPILPGGSTLVMREGVAITPDGNFIAVAGIYTLSGSTVTFVNFYTYSPAGGLVFINDGFMSVTNTGTSSSTYIENVTMSLGVNNAPFCMVRYSIGDNTYFVLYQRMYSGYWVQKAQNESVTGGGARTTGLLLPSPTSSIGIGYYVLGYPMYAGNLGATTILVFSDDGNSIVNNYDSPYQCGSSLSWTGANCPDMVYFGTPNDASQSIVVYDFSSGSYSQLSPSAAPSGTNQFGQDVSATRNGTYLVGTGTSTSAPTTFAYRWKSSS